MELDPRESLAHPRFSQLLASNLVAQLQASSNLLDWIDIATLHGPFERFPDARPPAPLQFYRTHLIPRSSTHDWKNHLLHPSDPLLSPEPAWDRFESRWIKFAIALAEPHRVYFQDSSKYPFHYDFAVRRLPAFARLSRAEFDAISLRRAGQQVVLGAVLFAPTASLPEIAIQFVGHDAYPAEQIAAWFGRVRDVIQTGVPASFFYFPTYEQQDVAWTHRELLARQGVTVSTPARWLAADECYAPGWAVGRLTYVAPGSIAAAYAGGRLRHSDILLTDAVPSEIPPLAGIITLAPATPNSHAAILAQSAGIPFIYFAAESQRERLRGWDGHEIALRAISYFGSCRVQAVNLNGQLADAVRASILEAKRPPALRIPSRVAAGAIALSAETLRPADITRVGGKAANFGLLRRALPANAPAPAIAFTFDLWDEYLGQPLPGGQTLRATIQAALGPVSWPPDMRQLQPALANIRALFTDATDFTPAQKGAILGALAQAGFEPGRRIRFRSSTNVEDSDLFSGAGLYDSFSGCLADDLDSDSAGPSACDPTQSNERGVFRALRKVYASFYNDNAFLERLRHAVPETNAGMAVLVHYSTPDEFELANGVATAQIRRGSAPNDRSADYQIVTQKGALSVANPDPAAQPEDVRASIWSNNNPWFTLSRQSSLLPLGASVFSWTSEYAALLTLLEKAARAYEAEFPGKSQLTLDFEYKKVAPSGAFQIKQIRAVPKPEAAGSGAPWLLNETNRLQVLQGEHSDAFAVHRLKSFWTIQTANIQLDPTNLTAGFMRHVAADYLHAFAPARLEGDPREFFEYKYSLENDLHVDRWVIRQPQAALRFQLRTEFPPPSVEFGSPLLFLSDARVELRVDYPAPQPTIDWTGPATTLQDNVTLAPIEPVGLRSLRQERRFGTKSIQIETSFYWPPAPTGPTAGYTAPLQAWIETKITGLTTTPLVLRGPYSQTYQPGHHNFWENFIFDPHLEPGLNAAAIDELRQKNIRAIHAFYSPDQPTKIWLWRLDGRLEPSAP